MENLNQLILKHRNVNNSHTLQFYLDHGGYDALRKVVSSMKPDEVIDEVKRADLRGRGGAGFPAGVKWSFVPKGDSPKIVCCNADEGEPGTFKDREIMRTSPHMLLEGILINCYAIRANKAFIYIRGEFRDISNILENAIAEAKSKNLIGQNILNSNFNCDIIVHRGAGAYICGEETALIESLEGKRGHPRLKPPFPAQSGVFGLPTNVNNVETLANIPHIITNGAEWFKKLGTPKNGGTKVFCISGHVEKPGNYELPMGTNLKDLIYNHAGGVLNGRKLKAVIPGGSSTPVLTEKEIDISMDFDSLAKAGSMLGSGAIIVMDETTCMVKTLYVLSRFYAHESCGQCTQCRVGTRWITKILARIENGKGEEADIDLMLDLCDNMKAKTVCVLSDALAAPVESFIHKFRDEFEHHIEYKEPHAPQDSLTKGINFRR